MKKVIFSLALLAASALFANEHGEKHWGYSGDVGPAHWGDLSEKNQMCKLGQNQSPINLTGFTEAEMKPFSLSYNALATTFINNGHTIQVNFDEGSTLTIDGKDFVLKQFHFHTPSENQLDGKNLPMEAHLVHVAKDGSLAVIAVLFKDGKENATIKKLMAHLPVHKGDKIDIKSEKINALELLPENKDYFRFSGSLTTPPCSEGVRWLVIKTPVEISKEQFEAFHKILGNNNRPVQPINARKVLQ